MKQKLKQKIKKLVSIVCILLVASTLLAFIEVKVALFVENPIPVYVIPSISVPKEPLTVKEYVLKKVAQAGLDKDEVKCLIEHEGNFNENAVGKVNSNGTIDLGIFQWNSQHIKSGYISIKCAGDYKCATKKFIEKVKKDGNYSAWYGYKNGHCNLLAKK